MTDSSDHARGPEPARGEGAAPLVSVLMVARNTGPFIDDAILTARRQTLSSIEIVVVDDGSTDGTRAIAEAHAAEDTRVRVLDGPRSGLAAVRNASLAAARARWVAILDSDDLLHPRHLEQLVAAADRSGATVVAANMVSFSVDEAGRRRAGVFADAAGWGEERELDLASYVAANSAAGDAVSAGYLKPLIDLGFLRRHALGYDDRLRIAEDYDLIARALAAGARFLYLPTPSYFYRRHAASTSNRLNLRDLEGMVAAADAPLAGASTPAAVDAIARRTRGLRSALRHARAVDALKTRAPLRAGKALSLDPGAWRMLVGSVREGVTKRLARPARRAAEAGGRPLLIGASSESVDAICRPVPGPGRWAMADGLPVVETILLGHGACVEDAAFAISPRAKIVALGSRNVVTGSDPANADAK